MTIQPMPSTPALILIVGTSMLPAMVEVERIFLRSDSRRGMTTRFLALNLFPRKNEAEWIPLDEALTLKTNSYPWKEVYELALNLVENLKVGIRSALHELRSHEKLIEVGLGGKTALPLDVYVVADLSEPDASAMLTLLPAIQSLLKDEPYAAFHVLLTIAVFDEEPVSSVNTRVSLNTLQTLLRSRNQYAIPQIYLFDRFKEGVWEAQNALEVHTILGNFLLALLSGGLAQNIANQLPQADLEQYEAYFCGASASAIVLDMEQLQKACALRLGQEIIEHEFHSKVDPNPGPIDEMAGNFMEEHANPHVWGMRLCSGSPFRTRVGGDGLEFHISDLEFEDVLMEDWGKTIQAYDAEFRKKHLPVQIELVSKNSIELDREFRDRMTLLAQSLPPQARLYPGGVRSARLILEGLRRALLDSCPEAGEEADMEQVEKKWIEPIRTSLDWLENAIRQLPKPPRWVAGLPVFLKRPAIQLFNLIYLHRELRTITDLRQASVRLLEQKYAEFMSVTLAQRLIELNQGWMKALDKQIRAVKHLQSSLDAVQASMKNEISAEISGASLFRLPVLNETLLAWAYYQGKRPQAGFRHALLNDRGFLKDWPKTSRKVLQAKLMEFCQDVYRSLSDVDLEEVLSHQNGNDNNDLAMALSQGAIPLLRPNFDQTGSGPSYQMRFFQSLDPRQSSLLPVIKSDMQDWQEVSTGDPYLALCCRVRVMIPHSALSHIFERGRDAFEGLDEKTKKLYSVLEVK